MSHANMEARLLAAIAASTDLAEQARLMARLDDHRDDIRSQRAAARELELGGRISTAAFTPVPTFERSTHETDWLAHTAAGIVEDETEAVRVARAAAQMWRADLIEAVKRDRHEFGEQAKGKAMQVASSFGPHREAAIAAFLREAGVSDAGLASGNSTASRRKRAAKDALSEFVESQRGRLDVEVIYTDGNGAFVSPDGEGGYWYDSVEEAKDEFGDIPVKKVSSRKQAASRKTAVSLTNVGIDKATGNGVGTTPDGERVQFALSDEDRESLSAVLYSDLAANFSGVSVDESDIIRSASRRRRASEGKSCSVCGDSIAQDPEGEDNRGWHHNNGEKHDHEAKPGGSEKESRRKQAGFAEEIDAKVDAINAVLQSKYGLGPFSFAALRRYAVYYSAGYLPSEHDLMEAAWEDGPQHGFGSSDGNHVLHSAGVEDYAYYVADDPSIAIEQDRVMSQYATKRAPRPTKAKESAMDRRLRYLLAADFPQRDAPSDDLVPGSMPSDNPNGPSGEGDQSGHAQSGDGKSPHVDPLDDNRGNRPAFPEQFDGGDEVTVNEVTSGRRRTASAGVAINSMLRGYPVRAVNSEPYRGESLMIDRTDTGVSYDTVASVNIGLRDFDDIIVSDYESDETVYEGYDFAEAMEALIGLLEGLGLSKTGSRRRTASRPIHEIAADIELEWGNVNYAARPYLDAMHSLSGPDDMYYADKGKYIVAYFLSNARSFSGPRAKELKAELKALTKSGSRRRQAVSVPNPADYDDIGFDVRYALSDIPASAWREGAEDAGISSRQTFQRIVTDYVTGASSHLEAALRLDVAINAMAGFDDDAMQVQYDVSDLLEANGLNRDDTWSPMMSEWRDFLRSASRSASRRKRAASQECGNCGKKNPENADRCGKGGSGGCGATLSGGEKWGRRKQAYDDAYPAGHEMTVRDHNGNPVIIGNRYRITGTSIEGIAGGLDTRHTNMSMSGTDAGVVLVDETGAPVFTARGSMGGQFSIIPA